MALTDTTGTFSYTAAGQTVTWVYKFPRTRIHAQRVEDEARRTTKHVRYVLEVIGYVTASSPGPAELTSDNRMTTVREVLQTPGGILKYNTRGFGSLNVNTGSVFDVDFGPKVELVEATPIGNDQCWYIVWRCEVCIPEGASPKYAGVAAMNWEWSVEIDTEALSTRTISGFIEVASNRTGGTRTTISKSADFYRELITPPKLPGYQRTQSYRLSKNKLRLDFQVTDKQLPVALPQRASKMECRQTVRSSAGKEHGCFTIWDVNFSGSVTLPLTYHKADAWQCILTVLASRIARMRGQINPATNVFQVTADAKGRHLLPETFEVSEDVLGLSSHFNIGFRLLGSSLSKILKDSGLWTPIAGTSFAKWQGSLPDSFSPRGWSGLGLPTQDAIVDLNNPVNPGIPANWNAKDPDHVLNKPVPARPGDQQGKQQDNKGGWIAFTNRLKIDVGYRIAIHKRLPSGDVKKITLPAGDGGVDATKEAALDRATKNVPAIPLPRGDEDTVQVLGTPYIKAVMEGAAHRVGNPIAIPRLVSVGGIEVSELKRKASNEFAGQIGTARMYFAAWQIEYLVPVRFTGRIPDLANPVYGNDGGQG